MFYENKWHTLDAALYQADVEQVFYLPSSALDNEGPGYAMSLAQSMNYVPIKISNVRDTQASSK